MVQLVDERKTVFRGKFVPVLQRKPRGRCGRIAQQNNGSFPLVVRTSEECVERWYVWQSKARGEIAAHIWDGCQI